MELTANEPPKPDIENQLFDALEATLNKHSFDNNIPALIQNNAAQKLARKALSQCRFDADSVSLAFTDYLSHYKECMTHFFESERAFRLCDMSTNGIVGRFTHKKNGSVKLALASVKLYDYLTERGIDKQTFKKWAKAQRAEFNVPVMLSPGSPDVKCTVLPMQGVWYETSHAGTETSK